MPLDRRDFLRLSALTGSAAATGSIAAPRTAEAATAPTRPRILLKGGYILTMDAALGDLRGDVLIETARSPPSARIPKASDAAIVDAADAIVIPGFIDSHRHTWQSQARQLAVDRPFIRYSAGHVRQVRHQLSGRKTFVCRRALGPPHRAQWRHHDDARLVAYHEFAASCRCERAGTARCRRALGLRHGLAQAPNPALWLQKSTRDLPDDIRRVRKQYFASNSGLVTMQMAGAARPSR